jgi:hypothetical protein
MFIKYLGFIVFTSLKQYFILAKLFKVKFTATQYFVIDNDIGASDSSVQTVINDTDNSEKTRPTKKSEKCQNHDHITSWYMLFIKYLGFIVFTSLKQYFILAKLFKVKFTATKISCDFLLTFFNIISFRPQYHVERNKISILSSTTTLVLAIRASKQW